MKTRKQKLALLFSSGVGVALLVWAGVHFYPKKPEWQSKGEPQKSIQEVMAERARQADQALETPLGKAVLAKDWKKVSTLYDPKKQFYAFAETVRAGFIHGSYATYSQADANALLDLTYQTLIAIDPANLHKAGLLFTQFMRLSIPEKDSVLEKNMIKSVLSSETEPPVRKIILLKLVQQSMNPPESLLQLYSKGFTSHLFDTAPREWIMSVDEIRNVQLREKFVKKLVQSRSSFDLDGKRATLMVWAHAPQIENAKLGKIVTNAILSNSIADEEAGFRALSPDLIRNTLSVTDRQKIAKKFSQLKAEEKTPYIIAKSAEVLPLLK